MKNLLVFSVALIGIVAVIFLCNCSEPEPTPEHATLNSIVLKDSNYVTEAKAVDLARLLKFPAKVDRSIKVQSAVKVPKEVSSYKPISSENGLNVFYIISYTGGGFAIVSADRRTPTVLAYSETDSFPTDTVPLGLNQWLLETKSEIEHIRKMKFAYKGQDTLISFNKTVVNRGIATESRAVRGYQPPPPVCTDLYFSNGPLLQTTWHQIGGYNNSMPLLSCVPYFNNGRAYTGCVATAMAQIIRYYQYPASYNYSIMPDGIVWYDTYSPGANEVSDLMFDVAKSVGAKYYCDGTGAASDINDIVNAFKNTFGYATSVRTDNYNYKTVLNELMSSRPVVLSGYTDESGFIFHSYDGGHVWVADGYQQFQVCNQDGSGRDSYLYFHMNWGWGGDHNGWFGFNNANSGSGNFQYMREMVVGIKKP